MVSPQGGVLSEGGVAPRAGSLMAVSVTQPACSLEKQEEGRHPDPSPTPASLGLQKFTRYSFHGFNGFNC